MVVEVVEVVVLVVDTDVELTVFSVTGRTVEVAGGALGSVDLQQM